MVAALNSLALLIFGTICVLALFKRHWTLVLIFCFFGYEQLLSTSMALLASKPWLINVMVAMTSVTALGIAMMSGKRPLRGGLNVNSVLVLALILFSYLGMFYGDSRDAGEYFVKSGFPYMILLLAVLPSLITKMEDINKMSVPYLVAGCALVVMVLMSPRAVFVGTRLFLDMSYTKGSGTRGNPLAIAEIGGIMVIIGTLMKQNGNNLIIAALRIGGIALGISICFLSASRGQLIFSILVSALFFPVAYEIKNIKQFFIRAGSLGFVTLFMGFVAKKFLFSSAAGERFSGENLTDGLSSRMYFASTMLDEYFSSPGRYLQGMGIGSFNLYVQAGDKDGFSYPHNLFIEILADHGLIGMSLLLLIILVTGIHTYKLLRLVHSGAIERHATAIVLALAGYLTLISMKQGSYLLIPIPFYLYLIISKLYCRHAADSWEGYAESHADDSSYSDYGDDDYEMGENY